MKLSKEQQLWSLNGSFEALHNVIEAISNGELKTINELNMVIVANMKTINEQMSKLEDTNNTDKLSVKVKCKNDVFGIDELLLYKSGEIYPTIIYKDMLTAQTVDRKPYPLGFEVIAYNINEQWEYDVWFNKHFEFYEYL